MVRAVTPIPFVKARFFDRCGKPLAGGKVHTYEANTTTPKVTYKDPYGLTPNTNPIILDAAGEADIYLDGTYRIRITDRNDVLVNDVAKIGSWFSDNLQDTLDNISGAMDDAIKPALQNLDDAINTAAAAAAGANGWIATLVKDASGKTQQQINNLTYAYYVDSWGAKGDGVTDDSTAIQRAIDELSAKFTSTGIEQTLLFNGSKTYVCKLINLKAGVHYVGVNGRATIKKTPAGAVTDENTLKWWRIFAVSKDEKSFLSATNVRHTFKNLIFDGNRDNMKWSGGYAQEQAASLFLTGCDNALLSNAEQRSKFLVQDCQFTNSVADGIGMWHNCDVTAKNIEAVNCFRGGFVASGGNSKLVLDGYIAQNARIDIEVDMSGFGGIKQLNWNINNVEIDLNNANPVSMAGADLCCGDGATGIANNVQIYSTPVNFNGKENGISNANTKLIFNNCVFTTSASNSNYIYPCYTEFNNVTFIAKQSNALNISWGVNGVETIKNVTVNFNECKFRHANGVDETTLSAAVLSNRIDAATNDILKFRNCKVLSKFIYAVNGDGYVMIDWDGGEINATTAFRNTYAYNSASSRITIGKYTPLANNVNMLYALSADGSVGATVSNEINFKGTVLPLEKATVTVPSFAGVTGRVHIKTGNRTITSDTEPTSSITAYNGDVLILNKITNGKPYEWICTSDNFSKTTTWRATKWATGSFATADLPQLTGFDVGVTNFDTTTNTFKRWSGTAWI